MKRKADLIQGGPNIVLCKLHSIAWISEKSKLQYKFQNDISMKLVFNCIFYCRKMKWIVSK